MGDNSTTTILQQASHSMDVVSLLLFGITCILGIPGNAFVIWIAGVKMKTTVNTVWYVSLAVADLLCCLSIPFTLAVSVLEYWPYGAAMCKILPTVLFLNMFASVFTLTLISLDRYFMIIWPIWAMKHRNVSRAWLLCGMAWFLALLLNLPDMIYNEIEEVESKMLCDYAAVNESARKAFFVASSVFGFFVPLLVITVCYLLIARRLSVRRFKRQKVLRIMAGVVAAFVVCWMPYHTVQLVLEFGSSVEGAEAVFTLAISLAFFNSCLNPVLYVFMGQDFKERVKVSLCCSIENAFREDAREDATFSSQISNQTEVQV